MRIGILGGSFDPVHYGHLLLAEHCREQALLDQVWFLPALEPPHKREQRLSPPGHRLEMLRLAAGGHEPFVVSALEIDRGGVSYTVDTLEDLARLHPECEVALLLGADSLADLPTWRNPARICELAEIVAVGRPGAPAVDFDQLRRLLPSSAAATLRGRHVAMPRIELASREIRRRAAAGLSIRFQTPRAVEAYIAAARLYLEPAKAGSIPGAAPPPATQPG